MGSIESLSYKGFHIENTVRKQKYFNHTSTINLNVLNTSSIEYLSMTSSYNAVKYFICEMEQSSTPDRKFTFKTSTFLDLMNKNDTLKNLNYSNFEITEDFF